MPQGARRVVGLDEAGRGSVLGPLVVGAFCCDEGRSDELVATGVRDSKQLTPARREARGDLLAELGQCRTIPIPPRTVDRYVRRGDLNELELEMFAALVRELRPQIVFVDACDPDAARFGRRLSELSGAIAAVVSAHHADEDVPVVSAASVVAKVARDQAMERLRSEVDEELGSGYPSDPATAACVERHARDGGAIPTWMRRSWETVQRVKRAHPAVTLDRFP